MELRLASASELDHAAFFLGTLAPERRASDRPMAIACFGLVTFFPLLPLLSLPRLNSCISRSTLFCALGLYLRPLLDDFFFDDELRGERDDVLPRFFADDELDLLRDELFFCAVAMRSSLLHSQTRCELVEVVHGLGAGANLPAAVVGNHGELHSALVIAAR
jgi:hypothetical protein